MNNFDHFEVKSNEKISFGVGRAVFYCVLAVFTMQIVGGIITIPTLAYPILTHVLLPLSFLLGICAAIGLLLGMLKTNSISIIKDFKTKISLTEIVLSFFIWLGLLPLTEYFTTLIPTDGIFSDLYKMFSTNFTMLLDYKIAGFITVCIFAPIFEEVLFRGIIFKGLLQHKIHPALAIVVSGFLFGMAHMNPWQFIGAGILGMIFAFTYYRTKSLVIPVLLHAINNCLSYYLMLQEGSMEESVFDTSDSISMLIFGILGLVIGFILYRITQKKIII
ncbi:CPBP family intramembrane glutamic endopeptidase [Faecalibacter rhinopitheci]|uniref:CPBP family intramembrane metalloprotease n=1 Tax=Faecalibacter rhinopitheci TaxID=2779678 RepID=A0A8J7FVV5_9FLAO|nr:type II CAAX endopeptidase family protein [Faecalibacter rhinopitheci]MBF0596448.1 CPBP family intramembrane metalloprotease [Faecalibacter rhinopitheci]